VALENKWPNPDPGVDDRIEQLQQGDLSSLVEHGSHNQAIPNGRNAQLDASTLSLPVVEQSYRMHSNSSIVHCAMRHL